MIKIEIKSENSLLLWCKTPLNQFYGNEVITNRSVLASGFVSH